MKGKFLNSSFFKYGAMKLMEDDIDEDSMKGDVEEESQEEEREEKTHSSTEAYASWDMYKEHLEPYKLDVISLPPDRDWKKILDIHTQDPHLRKLAINEKLMLLGT